MDPNSERYALAMVIGEHLSSNVVAGRYRCPCGADMESAIAHVHIADMVLAHQAAAAE